MSQATIQLSVSDLIFETLNWSVAKFANLPYPLVSNAANEEIPVSPSTEWAQGGPIITMAGIKLVENHEGREWQAFMLNETGFYEASGPTDLIAAMRCFLKGKVGEFISVPASLPLDPDYSKWSDAELAAYSAELSQAMCGVADVDAFLQSMIAELSSELQRRSNPKRLLQ